MPFFIPSRVLCFPLAAGYYLDQRYSPRTSQQLQSHDSNLITFPAAMLLPLSRRVNLPSCLYSLNTSKQTGL